MRLFVGQVCECKQLATVIMADLFTLNLGGKAYVFIRFTPVLFLGLRNTIPVA